MFPYTGWTNHQHQVYSTRRFLCCRVWILTSQKQPIMLESLPGPVGAQARAARGPGKQQWISTVWVHRTFCTCCLWFFSRPYVSRTRFRIFSGPYVVQICIVLLLVAAWAEMSTKSTEKQQPRPKTGSPHRPGHTLTGPAWTQARPRPAYWVWIWRTGISLQHLLSRLTRCAVPFGSIQLHVRCQDLRKHHFVRVRTGGHYGALVVLRLIAQRQIIKSLTS